MLDGIAVLPSPVSTPRPPRAHVSPAMPASQATPPTSTSAVPSASPGAPSSRIPSQPTVRSPRQLASPALHPPRPQAASPAVSVVPATPHFAVGGGVHRTPAAALHPPQPQATSPAVFVVPATPQHSAAALLQAPSQAPSSTVSVVPATPYHGVESHHQRTPAAAQPRAQPQASPEISVVPATPFHSMGVIHHHTPAATATHGASAPTARPHDTPGSFVPDTPLEPAAIDGAGPRGRMRLTHRVPPPPPPPPTFSGAQQAPAALPSETQSSPDELVPSPNATQVFPTTQFEARRDAATTSAAGWQRSSTGGQWQDSPDAAAVRTPVDAARKLVNDGPGSGQPDTDSGPVQNRLVRRRHNLQVCSQPQHSRLVACS
jgi:hypothetical protein